MECVQSSGAFDARLVREKPRTLRVSRNIRKSGRGLTALHDAGAVPWAPCRTVEVLHLENARYRLLMRATVGENVASKLLPGLELSVNSLLFGE